MTEQTKRRPGRPRGETKDAKKEFHLKFSPDVAEYIERVATQGYQTFFSDLVRRHMEENRV